MSSVRAHTSATIAALAAVAVLPAAAAAGDVSTPWAFVGIGQSQATLRIVTFAGACDQPLDPLVVESVDAVRITARNLVTAQPIPCPALLRFIPRTVHLAAPLAGRRLLGASTAAVRTRVPGSRLPRVVGLAPGDATAVLRAAGAKPTIVRRTPAPGLRRVVAQRDERLVVTGSSTR